VEICCGSRNSWLNITAAGPAFAGRIERFTPRVCHSALNASAPPHSVIAGLAERTRWRIPREIFSRRPPPRSDALSTTTRPTPLCPIPAAMVRSRPESARMSSSGHSGRLGWICKGSARGHEEIVPGVSAPLEPSVARSEYRPPPAFPTHDIFQASRQSGPGQPRRPRLPAGRHCRLAASRRPPHIGVVSSELSEQQRGVIRSSTISGRSPMRRSTLRL